MATITRTGLAGTLVLLPDAAVIVDGAGAIVAGNERAARLFGAPDAEALRGVAQRLLPGAALSEPTDGARRAQGRRTNDVPFALEISVAIVEAADGPLSLCLLRELAPETLLDEARCHLDAAFEDSPVGMALCNTDGEYIRLNDAMCVLLGRKRSELIGHRDQEFTHPDDRDADVSVAWDILAGDYHTHQCEKRFVRPDGSVVWALANLTFVRDEAGLPVSWVGQFQDITDRRLAEERLRELADQDPLTELLNRRAFTDAVEQHLGRVRRYGTTGAVLMIDLDGFKHLNDTRGHSAGDECLVACARALERRLRSTDALGRIGGDEFAALLPVAGREQAETVAAALAAAVRAHTQATTASVGVALIGRESAGTNELLSQAVHALYSVKRGGGDGYAVYA
jgi:diguanylate cyclase (GGDEF)-like protein/PAS domain S-box-containing protein